MNQFRFRECVELAGRTISLSELNGLSITCREAVEYAVQSRSIPDYNPEASRSLQTNLNPAYRTWWPTNEHGNIVSDCTPSVNMLTKHVDFKPSTITQEMMDTFTRNANKYKDVEPREYDMYSDGKMLVPRGDGKDTPKKRRLDVSFWESEECVERAAYYDKLRLLALDGSKEAELLMKGCSKSKVAKHLGLNEKTVAKRINKRLNPSQKIVEIKMKLLFLQTLNIGDIDRVLIGEYLGGGIKSSKCRKRICLLAAKVVLDKNGITATDISVHHKTYYMNVKDAYELYHNYVTSVK